VPVARPRLQPARAIELDFSDPDTQLAVAGGGFVQANSFWIANASLAGLL